jgi:hypothetical protein
MSVHWAIGSLANYKVTAYLISYFVTFGVFLFVYLLGALNDLRSIQEFFSRGN